MPKENYWRERMGRIGRIISEEDTPNTYYFSFVVEKEVKKGEFVQTKTGEGILFGMVLEITAGNRYYEDPEVITDYEQSKGNLSKIFPVDKWEYKTAKVKLLGYYKKGETKNRFLRPFFPPKPGSEVEKADEEMLKEFLGFDEEGINIGKLQHHDIDVKLNINRLFQKHLAILAMSGAGKSHLTTVILEELLDRRSGLSPAAILIDIHGEYLDLAQDEKYGKKVKVIDIKKFKVPFSQIHPERIFEWFPNMTQPQRAAIRMLFDKLKEEKGKGNFTLDDLINGIKEHKTDEAGKKIDDKTKNALLRQLEDLRNFGFLSSPKDKDLFDFNKDIELGKLTIFDFSTEVEQKKKQTILSFLARELFNRRRNKKIPPFVLFIEEAHNFAPGNLEKSEAIARPVLETIAREGRKFGACLCLISQRPVNLSATALSQCNTHIILRVMNPNDQQHIQSSSEGIDASTIRTISSLKRGEGIIVGEGVNFPVFVDIRDRHSKRIKKNDDLLSMAKEFEEERKRKERDVAAFL